MSVHLLFKALAGSIFCMLTDMKTSSFSLHSVLFCHTSRCMCQFRMQQSRAHAFIVLIVSVGESVGGGCSSEAQQVIC